jgi:NADH:ubiquinone oxidoreductase subunit 4 (subunit M)
VVTGFKYVSAQGNPEKLTEAHKYLWYTLIGTVIIMLAQGFALALSGTISQIFS